jgi:putative flippase GtrA
MPDQPRSMTPTASGPWRLPPFVRFLVVGATAFALNLALFFVLIEILGVPYLAAAVLIFVIGNAWGWAANRSFTFNSRDRRAPELARYLMVMGATLLANLSCLYVLVDLLRLHYLVAALIIGIAFLPLNYLAHRALTFRGHAQRPRR